MTYTVGSLFSGFGGLDAGVGIVLDVELAWYCEVEPAAVRVLEQHYPGVPNLGDITAVDWGQVAPVDIITGGFPCTDVSAAGLRAGLRAGTRSGLWAHMAVAIHRLQPQLVIVENVRGLLSAEADSQMESCPLCVGDGPDSGLRALGAVLGDLATLGWDAEWCVIPASAVDAPHRRERVFLAAANARRVGVQRRPINRGVEDPQSAGTGEEIQRERRGCPVGDGRATHADPGGSGLERGIGAEPAPHAEREPDHTRGGATTGRRGSATDTAGAGGRPVRAGNVPDVRGEADGGRAAQPGRRGGAAAPDTPGSGRTQVAGAGGTRARRPRPVDLADTAADPESDRRGERRGEPDRRGETGALGDSDRGAQWGTYGPAIARWERTLGRPAPAPTVLGNRGGPQLSPLFVEWMQGLDAGWVTAVPGLTRTQQLKLLGNGCVPQQVALALRVLLPRLFDDDREAAA